MQVNDIHGSISFMNKELEYRGVNGRPITYWIYRTEVNVLQNKTIEKLIFLGRNSQQRSQ